ncbi:MAG: DUF3078 domain-containing protein [Bacteroidota bacterium]
MIKKVLSLFLLTALLSSGLSAQDVDVDALKARRAAAKAAIDSLTGVVNGINSQIDALPGWQLGALGTIGFNFSQFNNWFLQESPNAQTTSLGFVGNAFANYDEPKYFWNNSANLNLAWTRLDTDTDTDSEGGQEEEFTNTADAFTLTSLFGYKFSDKLAGSALAEFRTALVPYFVDTLNSVSYLDLGVGATWTPIPGAVVVFHPLNYNFVLSSGDVQYESSLGCKIVADYSRALPLGLAWKTNLSAFVSYADAANLSNWAWINGLSFTVWKGIGVGIDFGIRSNKQESFNQFLLQEGTDPELLIEDLPDDENPLQTYWLLGLTYKI